MTPTPVGLWGGREPECGGENLNGFEEGVRGAERRKDGESTVMFGLMLVTIRLSAGKGKLSGSYQGGQVLVRFGGKTRSRKHHAQLAQDLLALREKDS